MQFILLEEVQTRTMQTVQGTHTVQGTYAVYS